MTSLYFVEEWVDNGYNYDTDIIAVWLDKQKALDFAGDYRLEHLGIITVEEKEEGVQVSVGVTIYQRQHYDHTQVLFNSTYYVGYDKTKEEVEKTAISQASPICVNIDWDRLYLLYKEEYCDEED